MAKGEKNKNGYKTVAIDEVPRGRRGKHHDLVGEILSDVARLKNGSALRVPIDSFGRTKMANVRAALGRAAKQRALPIVTTSDEKHLFVWRADDRLAQRAREDS